MSKACPTETEIIEALEAVDCAERFLEFRAKDAGLPISSVNLYGNAINGLTIRMECYNTRLFVGHDGRRNLTMATAYSFKQFDKIVDEAAAAYKAKKK